MKIDNIDIEEALTEARETLASNSSLEPRIKRLIKLLLLIVSICFDRLKLNSKNCSKPPSQDPNRMKTAKNSVKNKQWSGKKHKKNAREGQES